MNTPIAEHRAREANGCLKEPTWHPSNKHTEAWFPLEPIKTADVAGEHLFERHYREKLPQ